MDSLPPIYDEGFGNVVTRLVLMIEADECGKGIVQLLVRTERDPEDSVNLAEVGFNRGPTDVVNRTIHRATIIEALPGRSVPVLPKEKWGERTSQYTMRFFSSRVTCRLLTAL